MYWQGHEDEHRDDEDTITMTGRPPRQTTMMLPTHCWTTMSMMITDDDNDGGERCDTCCAFPLIPSLHCIRTLEPRACDGNVN
jgi:hypothetical protein